MRDRGARALRDPMNEALDLVSVSLVLARQSHPLEPGPAIGAQGAEVPQVQDLSVAELIDKGLPAAEVKRVIRMVDLNEYKRRQSPPGIRITTKAFGKDRRLPITNRYRPEDGTTA